MCEQATELQHEWGFERGDYFTSIAQADFAEKNGKQMVSIVNDFWIEDELTKKRKPTAWIWLPRQDQLQDMIGDFNIAYETIWSYMAYNAAGATAFDFISMEQFILQIYMRESFDKQWNGNEWTRKLGE